MGHKVRSLAKRTTPLWFAYECPCTKGKLVFHKFEVLGFDTAMEETVCWDVFTPVEYMGIKILCERCGKSSLRKIPVEEIDYVLDRLTPNVTYDPELREKILWYWDDGTASDTTE